MSRRGLHEGHEGTIPQTTAEVRDGLENGLVSLDANVLLSFYRFSPAARQALISVLEALDDRVFVSHQAAREFWRNRLAAIDARNTATEQLSSALAKAENQIIDAIRVWAKQTAVEAGTEQEMSQGLRKAFEICLLTAEDVTSESSAFAYDAAQDSVTQALLPLLEGRVGPPLDSEVHDEALKEAQRRAELGMPPGFRDSNKEEAGGVDGASGDYLVWLQSMTEAESRGLSLILVTGDEKDDWWWKHRGQLLGPRSELVHEFRERSPHPLIMLRPLQLIEHADVMRVTITEEARSEVERSTATESPLWTERAVEELLARLRFEGREHEAVILYAASNGGSIDRETLYDLCQYGATRMLRGFTRPTARITADLLVEGYIEEGVEPMLTPIYGGGVQALRFEIPAEVVTILSGKAPQTTSPSK